MVSVSNQTALTDVPFEEEVILSVEGVSKKFCRDLKRSLLYGVQDIATELIGLRKPNKDLRPREFWALNNLSFHLRRGEALGLVGKNGSGKSTLLRVISGLIRPDTGSVTVKGRLAPLIALGAGFNPVLSGRENIYANMSILGLTSQEIRDRFDEVVEFAEIEDAIDAPVHSYSSGMAARLGFACAIHTEPDILLIDEVLAVGDLKFRGKCYRRLAQLRDRGVSFILVSHSSNSILSKCESAVYLSKGELKMVGDAASVTRKYENDLFLEGSSTIVSQLELPKKSIQDSSGLDVNAVFFRDEQGDPISPPISGQPTKLCISCTVHRDIKDINLGLTFRERAGEGDKILVLSTLHDKTPLQLVQGKNEIQVELPHLGLRPSAYMMDAHLYEGNYILLDSVLAFEFVVEGQGSMSQCLFYQPRAWTTVHQP
ncbi:ABC transporter ATP-binding protein [Leptolyngbya boryana CZ1]|uniref:ABC transporter ATP-binding protein n=1 Tax=Leptolyngbya boryana CZ1 TaxID=3060204 RepID=A0AA96WR50_LEPBY|nr:ABC transporter ATP-binding protein [Leptolyngbya boryana]WNZ43978.1 ABC transporter ATP-binding protein [Leptolyngbya boryana CZ1]